MSDDVALPPVALENEDLLRNVPPGFVDPKFSMDEPSPHVFKPHLNDNGCLSVDRESMMTPRDSFLHRRDVLLKKTVGVLSVSTDDVAEVDLSAHSSEVAGNPAHACIDFTPRLEDKSVREMLLSRAMKRGWRYRPADDDSS